MQLTGIHHLTAITAQAKANRAFYENVLGLRLVKKTVNQDDVSAYHLFYADGVASPGTDITFFDWPAAPERRGTRSVSRTGFRVSGDATLAWWRDRLQKAGVTHGDIAEIDGRFGFPFEDPEGQRLALIDDKSAWDAHPWTRSPVPAERQILGLGPITLAVPDLEPTDAVLQKVMEMRPVRTFPDPTSPKHTIHVYEMGQGGAAAELHVAVRPDLPHSRQGAGGVHHVAFRTPDEKDYEAWAERLNALGVKNSGKINRYYFQSLYFREPNGVLFEIATDGPGFAADESLDRLGERLALPPFLEPRRKEIEAGLKPL